MTILEKAGRCQRLLAFSNLCCTPWARSSRYPSSDENVYPRDRSEIVSILIGPLELLDSSAEYGHTTHTQNGCRCLGYVSPSPYNGITCRFSIYERQHKLSLTLRLSSLVALFRLVRTLNHYCAPDVIGDPSWR